MKQQNNLIMIFKKVKETFFDSSETEKIRFIEILLFELTIVNRSIWSNSLISDNEIVEGLKWSNELAHRIWNILNDFKKDDTVNCIESIIENLKFYSSQSIELSNNISPLLEHSMIKFSAKD